MTTTITLTKACRLACFKRSFRARPAGHASCVFLLVRLWAQRARVSCVCVGQQMAQKMTGFQDPYLGPQWHVIKSNAAVIIKIK